MALNQSCIGKTYPPVITTVTHEAIEKYARACNDDNPRYFDRTTAADIVAPPLFAVTVTWISLINAITDPELHADLLRLLHRAQDMSFDRVIRPGDTITSTARIAAIEKAANGEAIAVELEAKNDSGERICGTTFTALIRGRRESLAAEPRGTNSNYGPSLLTATQTIDRDQTYRYAEASGDRNPIHVDENVARMAGLPGIIVHGLCTMAFTCKIMVNDLCAGDPARLKRLAVRFSHPVFPGQQITTNVWRARSDNGREVYTYITRNSEGVAVLREGVAEILP
jgi:acyl dehydratase